MKFVIALSSFVIFISLETQGVRIPSAFPVVFQPLNGAFPEPMAPEIMLEPPPMPEIPQQAEAQKHDRHGGYGGYGGYGPYRPGPEPRPRPGRCRDRKDPYFCRAALARQKCGEKRYRKKCAKTCGVCGVEEDCVDTGTRCFVAEFNPRFYCSLSWFAPWCRKTCNQCPTKTTTATITEPTTIVTRGPGEFECVDVLWNCDIAYSFRCSLSWFRSGCKKTCGVCQPATQPTTTAEETTTAGTTPAVTTEAETTEAVTTEAETTEAVTTEAETTEAVTTEAETTEAETTASQQTTTTSTTAEKTTSADLCKDKRDDCNTFLDWYCDIPIIADECQRFCGRCPQETTVLQTIAQSTEPETTSTPPTTETKKDTTSVNTEEPPTTGSKTTIESLTEETTEPEMTPGPEGSGGEKLCVDSDEKNCQIWESLGLCYHPEYEEVTTALCPLSCQICQP